MSLQVAVSPLPSLPQGLRVGLVVVLAALAGGGGPCPGNQSGWVYPHEAVGRALYASPQSNPIAVSPDGTRVYVANTTSDSVSVIDATQNARIGRDIAVGLDPVSVAVRPDGLEVWVANHVSDSVSVIDTDPTSDAFHQVIATIQDLDADGVTRFDEPVGIAFASDSKAYVALSSRNDVAVVEPVAGRWTVTGRVHVTAQEPRAVAVRGGRLYVAAFESGNQTELSVCPSGGSPPQCTLDATHVGAFATNPNLPGADKNIVLDPDVPDRDVFVYDTADETLVAAIEHVGTLLYGLAVDGGGRVFVTQTHARNAANGLEGQDLVDLDNRPFLNQIAVIDCGGPGCSFDPASDVFDLEPPVGQPTAGQELATPYGIAISADDSLLVVTAAASSRIAAISAASPGPGGILDTLDVGAIPRGVAFHSTGATGTAYVLDSLSNAVSVVHVGAGGALSLAGEVEVGNDRTPDPVRRGRIAFNDAKASTSGTFACASCHPDGHTDQLLWRIGGACSFGACSGHDEPRNTMPVRGLANTLPLHWDGTLGDPFGGANGAVGTGGAGGTDCSLGGPDGDHDCFLDLVNATLAGVMCDQTGPCAAGAGLSEDGADDLATFLARVSYPPARSRPLDDDVSPAAEDGFADFFLDQNGTGLIATCADSNAGCHALPLGTSTNSIARNGFDAPTMRGMTDRFLQFSLGITAAEEVLAGNVGLTPFDWDPAEGFEEDVVFAAFFPPVLTPVYGVGPADVFQMFEEASTGTSGALGRQVTLSVATATGAAQAATYALLDALESADAKGVVGLLGDGLRGGTRVTVSFLADEGLYQVADAQLTRAELEAEVEAGDLLATLTAHHPRNHGLDSHPQPLLAVAPGSGPLGDPDLPHLTGGDTLMHGVGRFVGSGARILLDGVPVAGSVTCDGPYFPFCVSQDIEIDLSASPADGLHLLQIQNPLGPLSDELPVCVGPVAGCL